MLSENRWQQWGSLRIGDTLHFSASVALRSTPSAKKTALAEASAVVSLPKVDAYSSTSS
jgi:hypothetical protein